MPGITRSTAKNASTSRSKSASPRKAPRTARKLTTQEKQSITIDLLSGDSTKGGPGTSLMTSSPVKRSVCLDDLPPNLSQFIMDMSNPKSSGANMRQVPNAEPRSNSHQESTADQLQHVPRKSYQSRGSQQPLKEGDGALCWFYSSLSSAEHTSLNDFFNFWTKKVPALFSEIKAKGGPEFHEVCAQIQNFKRTFTMFSKVHRFDHYLVELCDKAAATLSKAESTLNTFSKLPGLGCQTVAILKSENIMWLIGADEQKSAISILDGSQKICSAEFYACGQVLAHWHSSSRKRQHGGENRKKFEGKKNSDGKKDWKNKKAKGGQAEFSGNN